MRRLLLTTFVAISLVTTGCTSGESVDAQNDALLVYCGSLIDGISATPASDQTVVTVDGRISAIRDGVPEDGDFLDLSEHTCLPGLIDTHTHIVDNADDTVDLSVYYTRTPAEELAIFPARACKPQVST